MLPKSGLRRSERGDLCYVWPEWFAIIEPWWAAFLTGFYVHVVIQGAHCAEKILAWLAKSPSWRNLTN